MMENPAGSLIFDHPSVAEALLALNASRICVHLAGYGGTSVKPLWLVGTAPWMWRLQLDSQRRMRLGRKRGHVSSLPLAERQECGAVNGNIDRLRQSQEYPLQFSQKIAELHKTYIDACENL